MAFDQNYTLGRGKVHFSRFIPGTYTPSGFRYIGNTPEFSLTIESENLDHFSSDEGIREKDDSVPLEVNRTGSLITDSIQPENVSLFFFGDTVKLTQAAVASGTEILAAVKKGHSYRLGVTDLNPAGYFGINPTGFSITRSATPLVLGIDYTMNFETGLLSFIDTGMIVDGDSPSVTFGVRASTRERTISGSTPVEGALYYETKNPKGKDSVVYMPWIKVTPNGDYQLKGDEWQQIPLSIEVLKLPTKPAILRDGLPIYA